MIRAPSPNHGGLRPRTIGCVLHSTRGNASSVEDEFRATLNWFANPAAQVSAHIVIAYDGTIAVCVDPAYIAWHAGELNESYLGAELVQPRAGMAISDAQYASLRWWLQEMSSQFNFAINEETVVEHKDTTQGRREGKSDIGPPFSRDILFAGLI